MAGASKVTTRTVSWRDLVLKADPDWLFESLNPIVYWWPKGNERRDGDGPYANPAD